MKDKFYIINLEKELINSFDKYLTNFPHKEIELKRELMNSGYEMLKLTYEANNTYNIDKRIELQDKIISDIKYIDYLINRCYDKQIINNKRYLKFGENLNYLLTKVISWYKITRV